MKLFFFWGGEDNFYWFFFRLQPPASHPILFQMFPWPIEVAFQGVLWGQGDSKSHFHNTNSVLSGTASNPVPPILVCKLSRGTTSPKWIKTRVSITHHHHNHFNLHPVIWDKKSSQGGLHKIIEYGFKIHCVMKSTAVHREPVWLHNTDWLTDHIFTLLFLVCWLSKWFTAF